PNRDHAKGRIYRLVCTKRPLVEPATQFGRSTAEVLEQLKEPEWRTRSRARADLQARPRAEVLAAAQAWLAGVRSSSLPRAVSDRLATEVLWLQQSFHAVDAALLGDLLASETPEARAAATRVLTDERERLSDAESLLVARATDPHPRVRCEAVRGLSFFSTPRAMQAVVAAADVVPTDRFVAYTCDAALGANLDAWRELHAAGRFVAADTPAAGIVSGVLGHEEKARKILPHLEVLTSKSPQTAEDRTKALQLLGRMPGGDPGNGQLVFKRVCAACHKAAADGATLGPALAGVGTRLKPAKIVESIVDPNAEVAEQYLSTSVLTDDGRSIVGLVVSETPDELVIFDGKERRTIRVAEIDERSKLRQSSMPDGLAATLAPHELLDVVAYLKSLK
ncbi:MAG: HEAT repeat domain-containing protein, partial [Planctomycetaceae bacterium]